MIVLLAEQQNTLSELKGRIYKYWNTVMPKHKYIFMTFSFLFQPLYFLMLLMFFDGLQNETDPLAIALDYGIIILGIVFMVMQGIMMNLVRNPSKAELLKNDVLCRIGCLVLS